MEEEAIEDAQQYLEKKIDMIQQVRENCKLGRKNLVEQTKGRKYIQDFFITKRNRISHSF
jgi:hypothetical protein